MGPSLPVGPSQLEDMKAAVVADLAPDAVGRLGHRMSVEGHRVVLLHEDVERPGKHQWEAPA